FKIGVNHPAEGGSPHSLEQRLRPKFPGVHAIIHGHSHQTKNDFRDGVLWFNPGSATGTFPARQKTYGILTIDKEIHGEIIRLDRKSTRLNSSHVSISYAVFCLK